MTREAFITLIARMSHSAVPRAPFWATCSYAAYNEAVVNRLQKDSAHDGSQKRQRQAIYATETSGLLLVALMLLLIILIRDWHAIHRSVR